MAISIENKKFYISLVMNAITFIAFIITLLSFVYSSGKKEQRIVQLEKDNIEYKIKYSQLEKQVNDQNKETSDVNGKLSLLLTYFHITDTTHK